MNEYFSEWKVFGVAAFIEDAWIKDFKDLERQIGIDKQERERKRKEDPQRVNQLKKDFNIE